MPYLTWRRCFFGAVVDKSGVAKLQGDSRCEECERGDYTVVKGRIEGVAPELVNQW
jgi:hypothetical protein